MIEMNEYLELSRRRLSTLLPTGNILECLSTSRRQPVIFKQVQEEKSKAEGRTNLGNVEGVSLQRGNSPEPARAWNGSTSVISYENDHIERELEMKPKKNKSRPARLSVTDTSSFVIWNFSRNKSSIRSFTVRPYFFFSAFHLYRSRITGLWPRMSPSIAMIPSNMTLLCRLESASPGGLTTVAPAAERACGEVGRHHMRKSRRDVKRWKCSHGKL